MGDGIFEGEAREVGEIGVDAGWAIGADPENLGKCNYCGQCEPCPQGIEIALVNKLYDLASTRDEVSSSVWDLYHGLDANADDCIACGGCEPRCPMNVPIATRMALICEVFDEEMLDEDDDVRGVGDDNAWDADEFDEFDDDAWDDAWDDDAWDADEDDSFEYDDYNGNEYDEYGAYGERSGSRDACSGGFVEDEDFEDSKM